MTDSELYQKTEKIISYIENEKLPVHGLEVFYDSKLLVSWNDTVSRYPVYSITKSLVSIAFGIAESEGKINVSDSICRYIPKMSDALKNLTVERLLTMSVKNLPFRPEGNDWCSFILAQNFELEPAGFCYSNICAYLVGIALENALQCSLYDYLDKRVFRPLEIVNPPCGFSPEGRFNGASGVEMSVSELSKIGQMLMHGGKYGNVSIVPESYLERATSLQIKNREGGYGYFFWKIPKGFSLNGKWGQKCYCFSSLGLMFSFLSDMKEGSKELKSLIYNAVIADTGKNKNVYG